MRTYPESFFQGAASVALCWRIFRQDGIVLGFTQHDGDLTFGGIVHEAASGFDLGPSHRALPPHPSTTRLLGALRSSKISEHDIAVGLYDQARIETWLVNWQDVTQALLVDGGVMGEIKRSDEGFNVEIRSLADLWQQPRGRFYQALCAADLGDAQCQVALADARFTYRAQVLALEGPQGFIAANGGYASGFFTGGLLRFESGANIGAAIDVRAHQSSAQEAKFALWRALPAPISVGDSFAVSAGCDKSVDTCRTRFANLINYRGFPRMPGNDVLMRRVSEGTAGLDGGSLFA